jgi:LuxR family maltose regulon positive regulatory protein
VLDGADLCGAVGVPPQLLTPWQTAVYEYLSRGTPYAAIALDLRISVATVRTHTRAVFRKLGVKSRRELVGRSLPDRLSHSVM